MRPIRRGLAIKQAHSGVIAFDCELPALYNTKIREDCKTRGRCYCARSDVSDAQMPSSISISFSYQIRDGLSFDSFDAPESTRRY